MTETHLVVLAFFLQLAGNVILFVVTFATKRRVNRLDCVVAKIDEINRHLAKINGSVQENNTWRNEHKDHHSHLELKVLEIDRRCWQFHKEGEP